MAAPSFSIGFFELKTRAVMIFSELFYFKVNHGEKNIDH